MLIYVKIDDVYKYFDGRDSPKQSFQNNNNNLPSSL